MLVIVLTISISLYFLISWLLSSEDSVSNQIKKKSQTDGLNIRVSVQYLKIIRKGLNAINLKTYKYNDIIRALEDISKKIGDESIFESIKDLKNEQLVASIDVLRKKINSIDFTKDYYSLSEIINAPINTKKQKNIKENSDKKSNYNKSHNQKKLNKSVELPIIDEIPFEYQRSVSEKNVKDYIKFVYNGSKQVFLTKKGYNSIVIDFVEDFKSYEYQEQRIIKYYENFELLNQIPSDIENIITILYQYKGKSHSLIEFNGNIIRNIITWRESDKISKRSGSKYLKIDIKKKDNNKITLDKISEFYIYELVHEKPKLIIENGFVKDIPSSTLNDLYILAFVGNSSREKYSETIIYIKGNSILHRISNLNPCFSQKKKLRSNGSVLCQKFNSADDNYKDVSTIELKSNGQINTISKYIPEFSTISDFYYNNLALNIHNLDFDLIDEDGYVNIYYFQKECLKFYIIDEFTKNADYKAIIPNKFEDDDITINYHVKYHKSRIEDIIFITYILDSRRGYPCYTNGLYGLPLKNDFIAGTAIYNTPFFDYYRGLDGDFEYLNKLSQFYLTEEQKLNFRELVKFIYKKYDCNIDFSKFPKDFTNGMICADLLLDKLSKYVTSNNSVLIDYASYKIYDSSKSLILDCKLQKEQIKNSIIESGKYNTKWKSECELYKLVSKYFKDAIYQYHNEWLGAQSFDIYIPSRKIAIEYQGIQHYEVVDYFGGDIGYNRRKILDEKKRLLCKEHHVNLIEWKYTLPITKLNLQKFLDLSNIEE